MEDRRLKITGVLLTGGESRRMGRNKALLEIDGKSLIERNLEVLSHVCSEVLISSREEALYQGYGYPIITDVVIGKGPLGGLYAVLQKARYEQLFLVGCDMPFLQEEAIRIMFAQMEDYDAVVLDVHQKLHPLHAFYHKRIMGLVEEKMRNDQLRITEVLKECNTKILLAEEMNLTNKKLVEDSVWNVNTPDEWKKALKKINPLD